MGARAGCDDAAGRLLTAALLLLVEDGELALEDDGEAAAAALAARLRSRLPPDLLAPFQAPPGGTAAGGPNTPVTAAAAASGDNAAAALHRRQPSDAAGAPTDGSAQLRLQHSCRSTACGDISCPLCRHNTVQPCGRGLATRYLADDPLRAPCGAPVLVSLSGTLLNSGAAIEVIVIDGERYDGLAPAAATCSDAAPPPPPLDAVLRACAIDRAATRGPLVRAEAGVPVLGAEGAGVAAPWRARARASAAPAAARSVGGSESDDEAAAGDSGSGLAAASAASGGSQPHDRLILLPQGGLVSLSGLRCCASSEAVLQGKGSRFRLALRAVDPTTGAPLPSVGHAISDAFMVATRRMKQALKRDRPSTHDEISRLAHIGRATAEKLRRLAAAAAAEDVALALPPHLATIERVGQFSALAEWAAANPAARSRLLGLLKLSAANWAEAVAHASAAVPPDGRRRLFAAVAGDLRVGLLFDARNGALLADEGPAAVVYPDGSEVALRCIDARLVPLLPALKEQALSQWRLAGHPGWGIYGRDEAALPAAAPAAAAAQAVPIPVPVRPASPPGAAAALRPAASAPAPTAAMASAWAPPDAVAFAPGPASLAHAASAPHKLRRAQTVAAAEGAAAAAAAAAAQRQGGPPGVPSPGQAALLLEESLKRMRSETAEHKASSMAEARARLLAELRRTAGGPGAGGPPGPPGHAPWEVGEGGDDEDRSALVSMYRRWQQGSLTLPGAVADPVSAPLSAPAMGQPASAAALPVSAPSRMVNSAPLFGAAPAPQQQPAPPAADAIARQRAGALDPRASPAARAAAQAAALEAAPWLVLGDGAGREELTADLLTRSLREMSFEAFCGE